MRLYLSSTMSDVVSGEGKLTGRRKQKIADRQRVTGFARLYGTIRTIQREIESQMSDFEEQMEELLYVLLTIIS